MRESQSGRMDVDGRRVRIVTDLFLEARDLSELGALHELVRVGRRFPSLLDSLLRAAHDPALRARDFRRRRLAALVRGERSVVLSDGPILVLHVLPDAAWAGSAVAIDLERISFEVFGRGGCPTYSTDGKLVRPESPQWANRSYAQLGRTGWVEAATTLLSNDTVQEPKIAGALGAIHVERLLLEAVTSYLGLLGALDVNGPVRLIATLVCVTGGTLTSNSYGYSDALPSAISEMSFPEVALPASSLPAMEVPRVLRPVFDVLWQTRGLPFCPHFDDQGTYQPR